MFEQRVTKRFAPTQEAGRAHKLMKLEKYEGDIQQFLWRMENYNMKVRLQGVVWRDMLKAKMPEAGLLRQSFETYPKDELWLAGFKNSMIQRENHEEDKRLRGGKGESSGTTINRNKEDWATPKSNTRPTKCIRQKNGPPIRESLRYPIGGNGQRKRQLLTKRK